MYLSRSLAQANLPWYGIDFGNGLPNGRFSNGRTVADIIGILINPPSPLIISLIGYFFLLISNLFIPGDEMGLPRPPAFLDPSLSEDVILENGVNYASGGGGILNETGGYFVSFEFIPKLTN